MSPLTVRYARFLAVAAVSTDIDKGEPGALLDGSPASGRRAVSGDLAVARGPYIISSRSQGVEQERDVMVPGGDADGSLKARMTISLSDPGRRVRRPSRRGVRGEHHWLNNEFSFRQGRVRVRDRSDLRVSNDESLL